MDPARRIVSELRRHPFLQEWVITATHRQERTFLPSEQQCPFCPRPDDPNAEVPVADYEVAVIENRFPSLCTPPPLPTVESNAISQVRPSAGRCEVVLYTPQHDATLSDLSVRHLRKLVRVWADRYAQLSALPEVEYVYIFENKGKEVGVTLTHPHGQIYAYPFVPELIQRRLEAMRDNQEVVREWLRFEVEEGKRVVWRNGEWVLVVPFFARYPYEVHLAPLRPVPNVADADERQLDGLAEALRVASRKLDALFGFSMPYIMSLYQHNAPWSTLTVEITPPYRTATKLKYLAGSEAGCSVFINDTLPEETAAELRAARHE
ncbi:MAG: galactose-1-phosphate uridylyltransferase [Armatimonadota bacterium]